MLKLQRFKKVVINYHEMLYGKHNNSKINPDECIEELNKISEDINLYIDSETVIFLKWCERNVKNFANYHSILTRPIFFVWQRIIDYHLNKYSYNLSLIGIFQEYIEKFQQRLKQIKAFM